MILQNGSKMTVEPPRGIKANLLRSYITLNDDFLTSCTGKVSGDRLINVHLISLFKVDEFKHLLLSLCLFHAVLLERRKFGQIRTIRSGEVQMQCLVLFRPSRFQYSLWIHRWWSSHLYESTTNVSDGIYRNRLQSKWNGKCPGFALIAFSIRSWNIQPAKSITVRSIVWHCSPD